MKELQCKTTRHIWLKGPLPRRWEASDLDTKPPRGEDWPSSSVFLKHDDQEESISDLREKRLGVSLQPAHAEHGFFFLTIRQAEIKCSAPTLHSHVPTRYLLKSSSLEFLKVEFTIALLTSRFPSCTISYPAV